MCVCVCVRMGASVCVCVSMCAIVHPCVPACLYVSVSATADLGACGCCVAR